MSTFTPAYRLTVYVPRSVDASETTVLTPAAGAPHSDPFKVATVQGLTGFQPFLLAAPKGRRGRLDPKSRQTDTGTLSVMLMDKKTSTTNIERWVTAFAGNVNGIYNLVGLKVHIEERLTSTWAAYYTGRIEEVQLDGKTVVGLQLRDMGEELAQPVFVGVPHTSITYAHVAAALPRGLKQSWGPFPAEPGLTGTFEGFLSNSFGRRVKLSSSGKWQLRVATDAYMKHATDPGALWAVVNDAGVTKIWAIADGNMTDSKNNLEYVTHIDLQLVDNVLPVAPYNYTWPASGTVVTLHIVPAPRVGISEDFPLLIDDIHPVQLWKDMLDGKFGTLKNDGAVKRTVAYDATAFTNLIADLSFPKLRFALEKRLMMNEAIEELLCQTCNLSYYLDELGRVVPIDLRRKASPTVASTITDADLLAGGTVDWSQVRGDAITQVDATYYHDQQLSPEASVLDNGTVNKVTRIKSRDLMQITLGFDDRTIDLGEKKLSLDCKGLRFGAGERDDYGTGKQTVVMKYLELLAADYRGPFAGGAQYINLDCVRNSNTSVAKPGTFHVIDVDVLPDPGTNRRGGARLGLCTERSDNGVSVTLGFLDLGENLSANVPSISAAANAGDPYRVLDVTIGLNAQGEPVEVQVAVTPPGTVSAPSSTSANWMGGGVYTAAGVKNISKLPAGQRIWARARTLPYGSGGDGLKKPSDWVYAAAVDLSAMAAPSGLTVTLITKTTAKLTWAVSDNESPIEILLNVGGIPGAWTDDLIALILPPNTRTVVLHRLDGPSVTHGVGVRTRFNLGGTSSIATATFATTTTPAVAPRPAGIATSLQ